MEMKIITVLHFNPIIALQVSHLVAYQKGVMAMCTSHTTHSRQCRNGWCYRARGKIDYPLTVRSRTCNSLWRALANQQTITWTPHILLPWRCITYWLRINEKYIRWIKCNLAFTIQNWKTLYCTYCGFITLSTFNHMLFTFTRYINHSLTHSASYHRDTTLGCGGIRWRQFIGSNSWNCCVLPWFLKRVFNITDHKLDKDNFI
jgi:hypothetical protein